MEKLTAFTIGIKLKKSYRNIIPLVMVLMITGLSSPANGQCNGLNIGTPECEYAPFFCLNQFCSSTLPFNFACCNGWCGPNTIINNPQFYQFVAVSPEVSFEIHVDDCQSGSALQCGIIDECPWTLGNVWACDPGTTPGGTMILEATGLLPGQVYWLFIDGSNTAVCNFTITSTSGIFEDFELSELIPELTFASDTVVCPGYDWLQLQTGSSNLDAYAYLWVTGWNGDTLTSSEPAIDIQIPFGIDEGFWDICVRGYSGCDTTNEICIPIEIRSLADRIKDTATFCQNEFPFDWRDQHIVGPGTYSSQSYEGGCPFDSIWTVFAYPVPSEGILDTGVCEPYFEYEGNLYIESGTYPLFYPGQSYLGCDSLTQLNLELYYSDAFVEVACENNQTVLKTHITEQDENIDTITFEWYSCSFDSLLSQEPYLIPDTPGCYSLVVNSGFCLDTISSFYYNTPCEFNDVCYFINSPTCAGVETLLTPVFQVPAGTSIYWLIDYPGSPNTYTGNTDSIYVTFQEPGSYPVSFTLQDSFQTYTCHANMHVNTAPEVSLCCDQFTCDSCAFVTLSNFSGDPAVVNLNSGPPIGLQGNTMMNVEICSPEGFPTEVMITDVESVNGCPGTIVGDTVITITPLTPALVFIVPFVDTLCTYPNDLASYSWRYCDSTQVLSTATCFAPPTSGCYCLEVTNASGCTYETCTDFFLSLTPSIPENEIRISPNPTSGLVEIEFFNPTLSPASWQLTDLQGINILRSDLIEPSTELNFTSIPSGIYFLKIKSKTNEVLVRKIVIE